MKRTYGVIFDVDGVLIDSYQPHFQSWLRLMQELDVPLSEPQFRETFGRTNRDILDCLLPQPIIPERVRQLGDRKEEIYRSLLPGYFRPMPGAVLLIDQLLDAGYRLAVGSSGPPEDLALTLELLERGDCFQAVVTGNDVRRGKPDPEVFLLAAARLELPAGHCAVIEDAPHGITAAKRAGMVGVALLGTATREQLSEADIVVERLLELTPRRMADYLSQGLSGNPLPGPAERE